jgi:hypothetical protein
MTIAQVILYMFIGTPNERCELDLKWQTFKEKHIVRDMTPQEEEFEKQLDQEERR